MSELKEYDKLSDPRFLDLEQAEIVEHITQEREIGSGAKLHRILA